ncbi:hypothetical protein KIN20_032685 [Parelaphostrongylus tenuis]|uniref:Uncharacterized protein n=1 Tax=Parelaphostrongylus tenuis TaxID=148309 RepID=A0AAD5WI96_PARTN|nr:hypothetical protein KIN20_032685 [Parelaphostrongylus tenuis]
MLGPPPRLRDSAMYNYSDPTANALHIHPLDPTAGLLFRGEHNSPDKLRRLVMLPKLKMWKIKLCYRKMGYLVSNLEKVGLNVEICQLLDLMRQTTKRAIYDRTYGIST